MQRNAALNTKEHARRLDYADGASEPESSTERLFGTASSISFFGRSTRLTQSSITQLSTEPELQAATQRDDQTMQDFYKQYFQNEFNLPHDIAKHAQMRQAIEEGQEHLKKLHQKLEQARAAGSAADIARYEQEIQILEYNRAGGCCIM